MINLTPHAITVQIGDRSITFPPSGTVARVESIEFISGSMDIFDPAVAECDEQGNSNGCRVPVVVRSFGEVHGLPNDGSPCIVSSLVLGAVPGRPNTFAPDTGSTAIRNERGQVIAVTRLVAA